MTDMKQTEQILKNEVRLLNAMKTRDINALEELLHEDLIFNISTGQTITKSMDIENYQSGIMTVFEILAKDQIVQSFDDTSVVAVTINLKAKYEDQIINGEFRYLRVWKLFNNTWKVIAGSGFQI